mmetsp:Transcript_85779/g.265561  ORF Transcript_85779/g.265561 Transcript_85779/m.265561 type:complete len:241 (-) Transcript_85779:448-1170(-)
MADSFAGGSAAVWPEHPGSRRARGGRGLRLRALGRGPPVPRQRPAGGPGLPGPAGQLGAGAGVPARRARGWRGRVAAGKHGPHRPRKAGRSEGWPARHAPPGCEWGLLRLALALRPARGRPPRGPRRGGAAPRARPGGAQGDGAGGAGRAPRGRGPASGRAGAPAGRAGPPAAPEARGLHGAVGRGRLLVLRPHGLRPGRPGRPRGRPPARAPGGRRVWEAVLHRHHPEQAPLGSRRAGG